MVDQEGFQNGVGSRCRDRRCDLGHAALSKKRALMLGAHGGLLSVLDVEQQNWLSC